MRFKVKTYIKYKPSIMVRKFAWFPQRVYTSQDKRSTRTLWLEYYWSVLPWFESSQRYCGSWNFNSYETEKLAQVVLDNDLNLDKLAGVKYDA